MLHVRQIKIYLKLFNLEKNQENLLNILVHEHSYVLYIYCSVVYLILTVVSKIYAFVQKYLCS